MTRSLAGDLNPGPPALEASTIPLGYRGGGGAVVKLFNYFYMEALINIRDAIVAYVHCGLSFLIFIVCVFNTVDFVS